MDATQKTTAKFVAVSKGKTDAQGHFNVGPAPKTGNGSGEARESQVTAVYKKGS